MCRLLSYGFYFPEKKVLSSGDIHKEATPFPEALFAKCLDPLQPETAYSLLCSYINEAQREAGTDVFTLKKQVELNIYPDSDTHLLSSPTEGINTEKVMLFKKMDFSNNCNSLKQVLDETFEALHQIIRKGTSKKKILYFTG